MLNSNTITFRDSAEIALVIRAIDDAKRDAEAKGDMPLFFGLLEARQAMIASMADPVIEAAGD